MLLWGPFSGVSGTQSTAICGPRLGNSVNLVCGDTPHIRSSFQAAAPSLLAYRGVYHFTETTALNIARTVRNAGLFSGHKWERD